MSDEIVDIEDDSHGEPKQKTKLEQFRERLTQYPNRDTAKQHLAEIAKDLGCAKSLGYKALTKIDFQGEQKALQAAEPTAKIYEAKPEALEETAEEPEVLIGEESPTGEAIPQAAPPVTTAFPMTNEKLAWTFDLAFSKLADVLHYPDFKLAKKESDGLADAWMPVLQQYAPQMAGNPVVWAGISTVIIVAPRIFGYWRQRQKTKEEKVVPETPKEEPKTEPPKQEPQTEKNEPTPELPKNAGFLKEL